MKKKNIISSMIAAVLAISIIFTLAFTGTIFAPTVYAIGEKTTTISEAYIPSEPAIEKEFADETIITIAPIVVERVETTDMELLFDLMAKCEERKEQAHQMASAARALGHPEESPVILLAQLEWKNANEDYNYYYEIYAPLKAEEDARIEEEKRIAAEEAARKAEEERLAEEVRKEEERKAQLAAAASDYPAATQV